MSDLSAVAKAVAAAFDAVQKAVDEAKSTVASQLVEHAVATTPPLVESPEPVKVDYTFDSHGFLSNPAPALVGDVRVEAVVGEGCPHTVKVVETGHILSEPRPDTGEGFMRYCWRVSRQAGGAQPDGSPNPGWWGGLMFSGDTALFAKEGGKPSPDGSNWPHAADRYFSRYNGLVNAFLTPAEQAEQAEIAKAWAAQKR